MTFEKLHSTCYMTKLKFQLVQINHKSMHETKKGNHKSIAFHEVGIVEKKTSNLTCLCIHA